MLECGCGKHTVPYCCERRDCTNPKCNEVVGRRREVELFERVLGGVVCYTVLTVPPAARDRFRDSLAWGRARRSVVRVLKRLGMIYGVEISHPVGEGGEDFHPHMNFLWRVRKGFRPYIDVNELRQEWARILRVDVADVFHQYTSVEGKIRHWCRYVSRLFPGWHRIWTGHVRWFGAYPKKKSINGNVCHECGMPYRYRGAVSNQVYQDAMTAKLLHGISPPWELDSWRGV